MTLGPVTKLDKRNKTPSKKFEIFIFVIVIFPIYGQFEEIRKLDSGHMLILLIRLYFH